MSTIAYVKTDEIPHWLLPIDLATLQLAAAVRAIHYVFSTAKRVAAYPQPSISCKQVQLDQALFRVTFLNPIAPTAIRGTSLTRIHGTFFTQLIKLIFD